MDHQVYGYRWLRYLQEHHFGGLLADDMGLGKTVQIISLLAHLAESNQLRPALIVVPKSLVQNWQKELARFCPSLRRIYVHQGPKRCELKDIIASYDVVITTYQTLRADQLFLGKVDWSVIACDEAQNVKNPTTQATQALKGMKARLRIAMTGTPVENGLSELWCIVDNVQPGKLGSQSDFREEFEIPIRDAETDPDQRRQLTRRLQLKLTPHYIRREKKDALKDLPPKTFNRVAVPMGARQELIYRGIVGEWQDRKMIPLAAIQHMLACASHPELIERSDRRIEALIDECPKLQATLTILGDVRRC